MTDTKKKLGLVIHTVWFWIAWLFFVPLLVQYLFDSENYIADFLGEIITIGLPAQLLISYRDKSKEKKEYLFLMAEFDNFRKRTMKEKIEIMKNGAEKAMSDILPVIDDFERALQAMGEQTDVKSLKEGVELIYNKFIKYLEANGVKAIDSNKAEFDTELHEAVANFPTPEEELKGKVIDTVQKGYKINDKVLRHAKVVVGQ